MWLKLFSPTYMGFVSAASVTRLTSAPDQATGAWTIMASTTSGELRLDYAFTTQPEADNALFELIGAM